MGEHETQAGERSLRFASERTAPANDGVFAVGVHPVEATLPRRFCFARVVGMTWPIFRK